MSAPFFAEEIEAHVKLPADCKHLVVGRGSKTPKIVFVGEAPGKTEDELAIPFCGASGQLLDEWISDWGLDQSEFAVVNVLKWFPQDKEGRPRPPTKDETDLQRPWLKKQLQALNPSIVIALGATAKNEVTDDAQPILEAAGKSLELRPFYELKIPVLALPHPAYYLRNGRKRDYYTTRAFMAIHEALNRPKLLIVDIETDSTNVNEAKVRMFGFHSYLWNKTGHTGEINEMQKIIDAHTHLIGFNNREFDLAILKNNGVSSSGKIVVDLYRGLKARGRKDIMDLKLLPDNKLASLVRFWGLGEKKELDYNLLKKPWWTPDEYNKIVDYLYTDIEITKAVYEKWNAWAEPFESYISPNNRWRKTHLTCSIASYAYKAICFATGRPETYLDKNAEEEEGEEEEYEGGFVSADVEQGRGRIILKDFASLYPHNDIQGNLFSPADADYKGAVFEANEFYPELQGHYRTDALGPVETDLLRSYKERQKLKKQHDKREYALKIKMNSTYGAAAKPTFENIYYPTTAPDTTYIGRQNIQYVRKKVNEAGFTVMYSDTDSIYVLLPEGKTEKALDDVVDAAIIEIKKWLPFPQPTFKMDTQEHIKYFQLFRHPKTHKLLKKFYLYVTEEDKLVIKGLPFIKSNATNLGKKIFELLQADIIKNLNCKFPEDYIEKLMRNEVRSDIKIAAKFFTVKAAGQYKAPSQLDCQISKRYGEGKYLLIKNKLVGIGKGVKYCTVDEAVGMQYEDLDLSTTRQELHFFVQRSSLEDLNAPKTPLKS